MKLLDKKRLTSDANIQRKEQIDEGVRIARAVDKNREELASLQKQRELFFASQKAELDKAIGSRVEELEKLNQDIEKAKIERAELRKPLDDEWHQLSKDKTALRTEEEGFRLQKDEFNREKEKVEADKKLNTRNSEENERVKAETLQLNTLAQEKLDEAEKIRVRATQGEADLNARIEREAKDIALKRQQIDIDSKDIARREKAIEVRQKEQDDRERYLIDRYKTLSKITKL